ncbi:unnamed protein product, partial [Timema podura]|nr:unnamed protein product [Timema podura]
IVSNVFLFQSDLVQPIVTPRFAISCDMDLMKQLGALAKKYNTAIQTHIAENQSEIETVLEMFPEYQTYTEVYDGANLITNRTVLAHGIYLEDSELEILVSKGATIAHCPNSNTSLKSGECDVPRLLAAGISVGLGT